VTAFTPFRLGRTRLANRIVMAPMTRARCDGPGATPRPSATVYYAQRAGAGLIVSESMSPTPGGQGAPFTPGMHTTAQVDAWRRVTDAVHERGGIIFAQLIHAGRVSHPRVLPNGLHPVGPSALAAAGEIFTAEGVRRHVVPETLSSDGIAAVVAGHRESAVRAVEAGFDGVEIHSGNGFLLHQFLAPNANHRTDQWGGTADNRMRLTLAVVDAVAGAIGADRVGVRISPGVRNNDIDEPDRHDTYPVLVRRLATLGPAYLHVYEGADRDLTRRMRERWPGAFLLNPHTPGRVTEARDLDLLDDGLADLISFGAMFIANPDLPARIAAGGPYAVPDRATFYGGDDRGYIDYPALKPIDAETNRR
jgi:N-ethylmaleimide reductase